MIAINEYILNKDNINKFVKNLLDIINANITMGKLLKLLDNLSYKKYDKGNLVHYESRNYIIRLFNNNKYEKQYMLATNDNNVSKFVFIYNPEKSKCEFINIIFELDESLYKFFFTDKNGDQYVKFDFVQEYLS